MDRRGRIVKQFLREDRLDRYVPEYAFGFGTEALFREQSPQCRLCPIISSGTYRSREGRALRLETNGTHSDGECSRQALWTYTILLAG
jgi:hypothetical protein